MFIKSNRAVLACAIVAGAYPLSVQAEEAAEPTIIVTGQAASTAAAD